MGMYPKLIFLKGEIINSEELTTILQKDGGVPENFLELAAYLKNLGVDVNSDQIVYYGESDVDEFLIIIANDINFYTSIRIYGASGDISTYLQK